MYEYARAASPRTAAAAPIRENVEPIAHMQWNRGEKPFKRHVRVF